MKDKIINLRATEKEVKQINTLAKRAKMTRTDFIKHSVFNKEIVVLNGLKEFNKELKRIGADLSQLTKRSNMGQFEVLYLNETKQELANINDRLSEICTSKNRDEVPNEYSISERKLEIPSHIAEDIVKELVPVQENKPSDTSEIITPIIEETNPANIFGRPMKRNNLAELFGRKGGE